MEYLYVIKTVISLKYFYIYSTFYVRLMVARNKNLVRYKKDKQKESKHTIMEKQSMKEVIKRGRKDKENTKEPENINMALRSPCLSIITLNVDVLIFQSKGIDAVPGWIKNKTQQLTRD